MTEVIALKCPSCGAPVRDLAEYVTCEYCTSRLHIEGNSIKKAETREVGVPSDPQLIESEIRQMVRSSLVTHTYKKPHQEVSVEELLVVILLSAGIVMLLVHLLGF